jgi:hypothetical protein
MYVLDRFSKNTKILKFMTIISGGAKFFHAYGQTDEETDMKEVTAVLGNFADASKNLTHPIPTLHRKPYVKYEDQLTKTK